MKTRGVFIFLIALLFFTNASAQDSTIVKKSAWYVPDYAKLQFAGNIGFFSVGIGYKFLSDHLSMTKQEIKQKDASFYYLNLKLR